MRDSVLDSFAALAFLFQEPGHEKVIEVLDKAAHAERPVFVTAPNWAELRYIVERKVGGSRWEDARRKLLALPLQIVPADALLAEAAGEIKARCKMSLADAFAGALARKLDADLYTGDPEFKAIEKDVRLVWL